MRLQLALLGLIALLVALDAVTAADKAVSRIVNGDLAMPTKFGYFVLVQKTNGDHCGGALITDRTVVTAAHCIKTRDARGSLVDLQPLLSTLRIGCSSMSDPAGTRWCQEHEIKEIHLHPEWDGNLGAQAKDIAILILDKSTSMSPVPLAESATRLEKAEIMGYGQTGAGTYLDTLRYTSQVIESINGSSLITVAELSGPCYGDSGSPLVTEQGLVGLVSYGTGACDSLDDTDGYFYVPSVRSWINLVNTYASMVSEGPESSPFQPPGGAQPRPTLDLKDGLYALQVAEFGPCGGKYLSASVVRDCNDARLRLYSPGTVERKSTPSKPSGSKSPAASCKKPQTKKKPSKKKNKKNKNKKKKQSKAKKKTQGKRAGRSLLAAPIITLSTMDKFKPAATWKIITKPSDNTVYLESTARSTCVSPFVEVTRMGSILFGAINHGWILERDGAEYVHLRSSDTGMYISTLNKRCKPRAAQSKSSKGEMLKFRLIQLDP